MPMLYDGELLTFYNPDESEIKVRIWGNQFNAILETLDGYTIVKDSKDGFYYYAELSQDREELVPSSVRVGEIDSNRIESPKHLRPSRSKMKLMATKARDELGEKPRWQERQEERREKLKSLADTDDSEGLKSAGVTGDYLGLCLLVQFPDVSANISQSQVDKYCNKVGYNEFGNNGSVYDYFNDVSEGRFRYNNIVTAYYTTRHPRSYYTDPNISYGTRTRELINEALTFLKNDGFDFSQLSSDSQGFIYALNVFYAGTRINNWSEGLWPHAWTLATPFVATSTKKFRDYQITDTGQELKLGTFCHENGHMVCSFPDLYDYGYESNGVGHYCLMCFGGAKTNPVHINAYLKHKAGWTSKITTLTEGMTATLPANENEFLIHKKNTNEYFMIENRQQSGRNVSLPDAGLSIWHVDQLGSNNNQEMTPTSHYELSLEQADNRFDLEHKANSGDSEDLFGAPTATKFSSTTSPNSNWWDGTPSGLDIEEISIPGATMTIKVRGGEQSSIVGTWEVFGIDWGCNGSIARGNTQTFNADGTWTYRYGGGRWIQVGDMVFWNFENAPGLTYSANINMNAMTGIMGYAVANRKLSGCFYAVKKALPGSLSAAEKLEKCDYDIETGPVS